MRNRFIDWFDGRTYDWHLNHETEEEGGRATNISLGGNTSGFGLIRQQGAAEPLTLRYSGSILHKAQFQEMWRFFERSRVRTIYFRDFTGDEYEVSITSFRPMRKRGENHTDTTIPHHYWTYTLEMQVLRVISGSLAGVVTP